MILMLRKILVPDWLKNAHRSSSELLPIAHNRCAFRSIPLKSSSWRVRAENFPAIPNL